MKRTTESLLYSSGIENAFKGLLMVAMVGAVTFAAFSDNVAPLLAWG